METALNQYPFISLIDSEEKFLQLLKQFQVRVEKFNGEISQSVENVMTIFHTISEEE